MYLITAQRRGQAKIISSKSLTNLLGIHASTSLVQNIYHVSLLIL